MKEYSTSFYHHYTLSEAFSGRSEDDSFLDHTEVAISNSFYDHEIELKKQERYENVPV